MSRSAPQKSFRSRAYLILIGASVLLIFFSLNIVKEVMSRREISREIERLQSEITRLEQENKDMGAFLQSWDQSSRLEREARLKLGLQKAGEQAVMVVRPAETATVTPIYANAAIEQGTPTATSGSQSESNITKWWNYFFN